MATCICGHDTTWDQMHPALHIIDFPLDYILLSRVACTNNLYPISYWNDIWYDKALPLSI